MSPPSPAEKRLRAALARNLRQLREDAKLTLEEAAGRAGLHWRHWQKIEAGEVNSTLKTLAAVSKVFGMPAADLLEERARIERKTPRLQRELLAVYSMPNPKKG